jgi:hypothetical protein
MKISRLFWSDTSSNPSGSFPASPEHRARSRFRSARRYSCGTPQDHRAPFWEPTTAELLCGGPA